MTDILTLRSSDGDEVKLPIGNARISGTITGILNDADVLNTPLDLPNISTTTLNKIIEYVNHYAEAPPHTDATVVVKRHPYDVPPPPAVSEWDQNFCKDNNDMLVDLIVAANFLDLKPLLNATCKAVADMIQGKTYLEIREMFNIENDFTPEEEKAVRAENEMCEGWK